MRPKLAARAAAQPRAADGKFLPTHGAFALAARMEDSRLDRRRREVLDFLSFRDRLVKDLGVNELEDLPAQQQALACEASLKMSVLDAMKRSLASGALRRGGKLAPVLAHHYITWSESLRRDLVTLGLERRIKNAPDLNAYVQTRYGRSKSDGAT